MKIYLDFLSAKQVSQLTVLVSLFTLNLPMTPSGLMGSPIKCSKQGSIAILFGIFPFCEPDHSCSVTELFV